MSQVSMFSAASGVIEAPDLWEKRLPAKYAALCPRLVDTRGGVAWCAANQVGEPIEYPAAPIGDKGRTRAGKDDLAWLSTADGRRWIQDRDGVDGEVLYSTSTVWDAINSSSDPKFILACYRAYNDWLGELCAEDPDRFVGAAKIPTTGAEDATAELKRAVEKLKLRGVVLDAWPGGADTPPAMGECAAFWETAAGLKTPIGLYRPLNGDREPDIGIAGGATPEFYQDMTTIIYANIPDKNPAIRFVSVAPNAGWAPQSFEALSESYMRTAALRKVNLGDPDLLPSDYLRRYFYFVTQDDRTTLLNRSYFGDAHLMWGSFAFMGVDSFWPNTRQLFERLTGGMPDDVRQRIAGDVVRSLYGLAESKPFTQAEINDYARYALI
ncbi:MAG: amidohydrolase family protein [Hyphomonadaceae bacterium]